MAASRSVTGPEQLAMFACLMIPPVVLIFRGEAEFWVGLLLTGVLASLLLAFTDLDGPVHPIIAAVLRGECGAYLGIAIVVEAYHYAYPD